jgi:M6 family metalloprotease-like protein
MASQAGIPALKPRSSVHCGEGPTDFKLYMKPLGTVKAVMIFVDFSDAPGKADPAKVADHLLGGGRAQQLYRDQSYGKLKLDVAVRSDLGWRRMPKPSTGYSFRPSERHREYIADAARQFVPDEVRFKDFQFTFVVAPEAAAFPDSPAFTAFKGTGAKSPSGEIRLAVTFGKDSYKNSFINLVHEVGHLFGMPDLYADDGGGADTSKAGCWAIMSDIFHAEGFLGWHRHKNGWLDAGRTRYLPRSGTERFTLAPLSAQSGVSMVVAPVDSEKKPSRVFVVELAQPAVDGQGRSGGEGVLLYTVDASIATLKSPVQVVAKQTGRDPDFGNLFGAPFGVGDEKTHTVGGASFTLRVLGKNGDSYDVEVDYFRP